MSHKITASLAIAAALSSAPAEGRTVGSAIVEGMANVPGFDLGECFSALITVDIVIALELPNAPPDIHI